MIEITNIKIFKVNETGSTLANLSVTFADVLVVSGFRIMQSKNGLFLSNPSVKAITPKDGKEYVDTVFPLTKEYRTYMQNRVLDLFDAERGSMGDWEPPKSNPPSYQKTHQPPTTIAYADDLPF